MPKNSSASVGATTLRPSQLEATLGSWTKEMMEKIDMDRDGTISQAEFIAYLTKIFDMMDTSTTHKGKVSKEEVMFATGGYNRQ